MIKKLRIRFILTALAGILLVLVIMIGAINYLNYRGVTEDADRLLLMIAENGGSMPKDFGGEMDGKPPEVPDGSEMPEMSDGERPEMPAQPGGQADGASGTLGISGNRRGGIFSRNNGFSEETPFESRFFTVTFWEDEIVAVSTENIAAVDNTSARTYAEEAKASGKEKGFLSQYRYLRSGGTAADGAGDVLYVFLDCSRTLSSFWTFLFWSLMGSLGAFLLAGALVILFSGRVLRPVKESYEKQKRFITDAGHELKTPVAVIEADASVLELEAGKSEWIDDIKVQTKRLEELTGELTYLTRMDEGSGSLTMIEFPLSDVASEAAGACRARALLEEKTFTEEIEPGISYTGDEAAIRKLLSILLDNAMKYSEPGGEVKVRLEGAKNPRLTVYNTANIDPETVPHLFERFYRGDKSRSSEKKGFGIGLSIAKAVVDAHKGKIRADSDGKSLSIQVIL